MGTTSVPCNLDNYGSTVAPVFNNGSLNCNATYQAYLENENLVFGERHQIRIAITWILFVVSTVGNLLVLFSVTCWRKNYEQNQGQLIILNLSAANLAFTFFILPVDGIWNFTIEWVAGDFMCRILNMLKQFSMYASSSVIVVMSLDKVTSLLAPASTPQHFARVKKLLTIAWFFSAISSIPAGVMFSVIKSWVYGCKCPDHAVTQCVDYAYVGPPLRQIFYTYSLLVSFVIPLVCVIVCYVIIAANIAKMAKRTKEFERQTRRYRGTAHKKGLARQILERARRMSLLATMLISAAFLISWGPYYIIGAIYWYTTYDPNNMVTYILLMTSYLNPCIHPIITIGLVQDVRQSILKRKSHTWRKVQICISDARHQHNPLSLRDIDPTKRNTLGRNRPGQSRTNACNTSRG